jgi:hypothetical protein
MACRKVNRVTETTNEEESDGRNLKPIRPILKKKAFENQEVLV